MLWHSKRFSNRNETIWLPLLNAGFEPRISGTEFPADWMSADKPTELSIMISEHSALSTPLPVGFRTWLWLYTCLLLLSSMLWHRQAIFESKGDKLSSSAECRIRTQGLWNRISNKTECLLTNRLSYRGSSKNLNSIARPYDQRAFSPLNPTAGWLSHLTLATYTSSNGLDNARSPSGEIRFTGT